MTRLSNVLGNVHDSALEEPFPARESGAIAMPASVPWRADEPSRLTELDRSSDEEDTVFIFRVVKESDAAQAFNAQNFYAAGRFTSRDTPVIYASLSPAGAVLEVLAHLQGRAPDRLVLAVGSMPTHCAVADVQPPLGWDATPYRPEVQSRGDAWLAVHQHLAIRVPSALVPCAYNVLIDPLHAECRRIVLVEAIPITIDARLRT